MSPLSRSAGLRTAGLAAVATLALATLTVATPVEAGASAAPAVPATAGKPAAPATAARPVAPGSSRDKAASNDLTFGLRRGQQLVRQGSSTTEPSTIVSFDLPPAGRTQPLGGYGTYLVLQSDGNLVEYESTTGKVLFVAGNKAGTRFVYQTDGNAVLYSASGQALFNTGTRGDRTGQVLLAYGNGQMIIQSNTGQVSAAFGTAVTRAPGVVTRFADSPSGRYELIVQPDGNLVVYDLAPAKPRAIWNTRTAGRGKVRFAVQSDGNLVLYAYPSNTVVWTSHTANTLAPAYYQLDVQNNGNVVLWRTNGTKRTTRVWQSNSGQN